MIVDPGDHRRQIWVKPAYTGYRTAWQHVHVHLSRGMHVDHIYNRARARVIGYQYVRLFLCPEDANERHGRFLEQRLTNTARPLALVVRDEIVYASNWTIAKMAGIAIDQSNPS